MRRWVVLLTAATAISSVACRTKDMNAPVPVADHSAPSAQPAASETVSTSSTAMPATMTAATVTPATPALPAPMPLAPAHPVNAVTMTNADPNAAARRISLAEAEQAWKDGNVLIVDVRTDEQWNDGHVQGAIHIPYSEVTSHLSALPKDKLIITYCS
jgi:hypothetical protein